MKASIIVFSPSGHTLKVANRIKDTLVKNNAKVQLINITKDDDYLDYGKIKEKLKKELDEHDVLFIGGPLYAGHVEKHILQLIEQLPAPCKKYSELVVPFVTYGGVHTSVALEEMAKLIKIGGRKSILGIKITAEHTLTKAFGKYINEGKPNEAEFKIVDEAVEKVLHLVKGKRDDIKDASKALCYSSMKERMIFKTLSQDFLHKKYKNVSIDKEKCIGCKKCVAVCPVNMYRATADGVEMNPNKDKCILCAECYHNCPAGAIDFTYFEKARIRLKDGYAKMEQPQSEIYR